VIALLLAAALNWRSVALLSGSVGTDTVWVAARGVRATEAQAQSVWRRMLGREDSFSWWGYEVKAHRAGTLVLLDGRLSPHTPARPKWSLPGVFLFYRMEPKEVSGGWWITDRDTVRLERR
jgi:hypothetical protein